jgi:hypothetical protein
VSVGPERSQTIVRGHVDGVAELTGALESVA